MRVSKDTFFSIFLLMAILIVVIIWTEFLSPVEIVFLLALYLFAVLMLQLFIRNQALRLVLEHTASILVDWYIGLKIVYYFRPGDYTSVIMWTAFVLFAYLVNVKKLWGSKK